MNETTPRTQPQPIVSLSGHDVDFITARLAYLEEQVSLVELRLDGMPADAPVASWVEAHPQLAFVATYRLREDGGEGEGGAAERRRRLEQAIQAGVAFVDLPLGEERWAWPSSVRRVLSWHAPTAPSANAAAQLAEAWAAMQQEATSTDVLKLVTWAEQAADARAILALQREAKVPDLVAFAQGPGSAAARLLSARFGAPWVYCCWPGEATAPGQWSLAEWQELPEGWHAAATALVGVAGQPVRHSLSPWLWQQAAARATPPFALLDLALESNDLAALLPAVESWGLRALSLTMPLKQQAYAHFQPPQVAEQAVNYLVRGAQEATTSSPAQASSWIAGNSDGEGALAALRAQGLEPTHRVLLLGAGGAARGVAKAMADAGHAVTVSARRREQAAWWPQVQDWEQVAPQDFDVVIQATSLGSAHNPGLPLSGRPPRAGALALELIYQPLETAWMAQARQAGAKVLPGTTMLLEQMRTPFAHAFPNHHLSDAAVAELQASFAESLSQEQAAVLIGPRASGKSTLGRALAQACGWSFVDSDEELERIHQRSLPEWIAEDLASFRQAESALLPQLLGRRRHVIALGGGVIEDSANVARLQRHGRVLALTAAEGLLLERQQQNPRPRLEGATLAEEVAVLHERRQSAYAKAAKETLTSDCPLIRLTEQAQKIFALPGFGQR